MALGEAGTYYEWRWFCNHIYPCCGVHCVECQASHLNYPFPFVRIIGEDNKYNIAEVEEVIMHLLWLP